MRVMGDTLLGHGLNMVEDWQLKYAFNENGATLRVCSETLIQVKTNCRCSSVNLVRFSDAHLRFGLQHALA